MPLPNPGMNVIPFDPLPAATLNDAFENIEALAAGTGLNNGAVTSVNVATGFAVQQVGSSYSAVATGTTTIPFDDTIPQITEGNEYMTLAITPKSATNILEIRATAMLGSSAAAPFMIMTLFQDSGVNAIAASCTLITTATGSAMIPMVFRVVAGTTGSTTFRIRAGANLAGTTTFNGQSGNRFFGGIQKSSLVITEYKA